MPDFSLILQVSLTFSCGFFLLSACPFSNFAEGKPKKVHLPFSVPKPKVSPASWHPYGMICLQGVAKYFDIAVELMVQQKC